MGFEFEFFGHYINMIAYWKGPTFCIPEGSSNNHFTWFWLIIKADLALAGHAQIKFASNGWRKMCAGSADGQWGSHLSRPEKTADPSLPHHWFPCEMTS